MNLQENTFPFAQKKVAATGKLKNYTRLALMDLLKKYGAITMYNVSRRTDYLIVGTKPGTKFQRALAFGTRIISESEFETIMACLHTSENTEPLYTDSLT